MTSFVLPSGDHCSLGERLLEKKTYRVEQIGEETMDQRDRERKEDREREKGRQKERESKKVRERERTRTMTRSEE